MASSIDKTQTIAQSAPGSPSNETARGRSIATRLTDAEFGEVEAAAGIAGKKVGEWLREAALAQARGAHHDEQTDQILLAELMGMRSLMLNLFARASEGPLTTEDLRKMSAYSDSIKEQRAQDYMAQRRRRNSPKAIAHATARNSIRPKKSCSSTVNWLLDSAIKQIVSSRRHRDSTMKFSRRRRPNSQ
jgi:hypothetical protein